MVPGLFLGVKKTFQEEQGILNDGREEITAKNQT
jgi:hypothetical protein